VLAEVGTTYSAIVLLRRSEVSTQLYFMLLAVIVLSLMLLALVNFYPGA